MPRKSIERVFIKTFWFKTFFYYEKYYGSQEKYYKTCWILTAIRTPNFCKSNLFLFIPSDSYVRWHYDEKIHENNLNWKSTFSFTQPLLIPSKIVKIVTMEKEQNDPFEYLYNTLKNSPPAYPNTARSQRLFAHM